VAASVRGTAVVFGRSTRSLELMRSGNGHFRCLALGATLAISPLAFSQSTPDFTFFSWYDGWGTHQVWGVGKIFTSAAEASLKCGPLTVKVVPIYDTHSDLEPPNKEQTSEFAKSHNVAVLKQLQSNGLTCEVPKRALSGEK
jgi:hypothetical protein